MDEKMDPQKRETVLQMVQSLWQRQLNSIHDLKDGQFYIHALNLLYQFQKKVHFERSEDRLEYTKTFLQGIYGADRVEKYLNFHILTCNPAKFSKLDEEFELSKIALVLYGIGVLDKNRGLFVESALKLPANMHADIMALIQAVVQARSVEMLLTDNIEAVLRSPSDLNISTMVSWFQSSQPSISLEAFVNEQKCLTFSLVNSDDSSSPPPGQNPHLAGASTSKDSRLLMFTPSTNKKDSHCRVKNVALNNSLSEITSPLKDLTIDVVSPASPFLQFVQSPQVIQKATINQKDMENRKLKQQLMDEQYAKDELQDQLRDQLAQIAQRDAENASLKERIKNLLPLQDEVDKLEELRIKYAELESDCNKLTIKVADHENCKEQINFLEKISDEQSKELDKLYKEVRLLDMEREKNAALAKNIQKLESEIKNLHSNLDESNQSKDAWTREKNAILANLEQTKQLNDVLRQELEESQAIRNDTAQGECMGVILEIQIREIRSELDGLRSERDALQLQIDDMQRRMDDKDKEIAWLKSTLLEKDNDILDLQENLTSNKEQKSSLEVKLQENIQGHAEILLNHKKKVEELISQLQVSENQIQHLEATNNQEDMENQKLKQQLMDEQYAKDELQDQLRHKLSLIAQKDAENASLLERINKLLPLQDEVDKLEELRIKLESECTELTIKVADYENCKEQINFLEKTSDEQNQELDELYKEKSSFEVQLQENIHGQAEILISHKKEVEELKSQLQVSEMHNKECMTQLQHFEATINQEDMENQKLKQQLMDEQYVKDELQDQLRDKLAQIVQKDAENASLLERINKLLPLQDEVDKLEELRIKLESECTELTIKVADYENCKEQINFLEKTSDEQNQELDKLYKEKSSLEVQLQENIQGQAEILISHKKEVEELKSQLQVSEMHNKECITQIQHFEDQLRDKLALIVQKDAENASLLERINKLLPLQDEVDKLEELRIKLESECTELTIKVADHENCKQQINSLEKTSDEQNQELDKLYKEENIHGQAEILISHKKEVEELKSQLKVSEMHNKECMTQIQHFEATINQEDMENQKLKQQLMDEQYAKDELQDQLRDKLALIAQKDAENASLLETINNFLPLQDEVEKLEELRIKLESECTKLTIKVADYENCKEQINFLEKTSDEQNQELDKLYKERSSLEVQLQENIHGQAEILMNHKKEVEELKSQLQESEMHNKECMTRIQHFEVTINKEDMENQKLKQQLMDEQYAKDELQHQLRDKLALIALKDTENASLQERINNLLPLQVAVDKLEALRIKLETECTELTKKVADHENCKEQINSLEKTSDEQNQELDKLYEERSSLEVQIQENIHGQAEILISHKKEVEELKSQLQVSEMHNKECMTQIQHFEATINQEDMENQKLKQQLMDEQYVKDEFQDQLRDKLALIAQKDAENASLQERINNLLPLEDEVDKLEELRIKLESECTELTIKVADHENCKEQINSLEKTSDEQNQELDKLYKEKSSLEVQLQGQVEKLINHKKEVEELKSQLQVSEMHNKEYMTQIQHFEATINQEDMENQKLKQQLMDEQYAKDEFQDQLRDKLALIALKDAENASLQERINKLLPLQDEVDKLEELRIKLESECTELTIKVADHENCKEQINSLEKTLDEQNQELDKLYKEKSSLEVQFQGQAEILINHKKEVKELINQLQVSEMHNKEYITQIQHSEATINQKDMENQTLKQQLMDEQYTKDELQDQLRYKLALITQKDAEIASLKEMISNLQDEVDKLKELRIKYAELESECTKLTIKVADHENCKEQINSLEKTSDEQNQELDKLYKEKSSLEVQLQGQAEILINHKKEVEELKSQLQVSEMHNKESITRIQHLEADVNRYKKMSKTLQEEAVTLREREKRLLNECDVKISKARDFCNDLRRQLEETNKKLEESKKETKQLTDISERADSSLQKMKTANESLNKALKLEMETNSILKKRTEAIDHKFEEMRQRLETAQKENKNYVAEISRLKTAVDYSDRKIREYKHLLDHSGTVHLGDSSHFRKIIEQEEPDHMEESISSVDSKRKLRSHTASDDSFHASSDETILTADKVMLRRETLASATDLRSKQTTGKSYQSEDRLSLCSVSSAQSIKSKSDVPVGFLPNANSCANEPEDPDFEWDRLNELQRRNTLYLPHMKSAYPVELQTSRKRITDDSIRLSLMPDGRGKASPGRYNTRQKDNTTRAGYGEPVRNDKMAVKRKAMVKQGSDEQSFDESPAKQLRTAPVYQRPGPPTPGKQPRRISGRYTPSHGVSPAVNSKIKALGSPIARPNPRLTPGRKPSRRSPRLNSQMAQSSSSDENDRRESVAFNIGFTPGKSKGPKGFLQKTLFGSKAKNNSKGGEGQEAQADQQKKRKPLGARNFLETGI